MPKKKKGWRYSEAKKLLKNSIIKGLLDNVDPLGPRFVYDIFMYLPDFHEENYNDYDAFTRRYRDLKKSIDNKRERSALEEQALAHDRAIYPVRPVDCRGIPRWDGSEAQKSLRADMDAKKHLEMKPSHLRVTNDEYKRFPLDCFRGHIDQEKEYRKLKAQYCKK